MDDDDKTFIDIDDLAKKIEKRIKELNDKTLDSQKSISEYKDHLLGKNITDLTSLIKDIDERIAKIENSAKEKITKAVVNIDDLTDKVNAKLDMINDNITDDLEKTIYDLSEISKIINSTMAKLEKQKEKKRKKAMYCEMARAKKNNNHKKQK